MFLYSLKRKMKQERGLFLVKAENGWQIRLVEIFRSIKKRGDGNNFPVAIFTFLFLFSRVNVSAAVFVEQTTTFG